MLSHKNNQATKQPVPLTAQQSEFVSGNVVCTKYGICDPNKIICNYSVFAGCEYVPVALEDATNNWVQSHNFPTIGTISYLDKLKNATSEIRKNPIARTIVEYDLGNNKTVIFLPTRAVIATHGWSECMTPEIRRHMVAQMKKYRNITL